MKNMSSFKKSVLSIVFMSAVTGSFISWDKYQPRHETPSLVEFYQDRNLFDHFVSMENTHSAQNKTLAMMAEENSLIEAELIAQTLAENMFAMEAEAIYRENLINSETYLAISDEDTDVQALETNNVNHQGLEAVISEKVLFAFDSSEVADGYLPLLNETAIRMQSDVTEDTKIWQVVGYADLQGNNIYNSRLAKKRAQAVSEYLVNKGVDEDKLMVVSLGESQTTNRLQSEENKRLARRVEIHDYDNLVVTLAEQFNSQIKQEIANQKKYELLQLKRQQIAYQQQLQQQKEIKALAEVQPITAEVDNQFEFSQQQKENLTTVMKL